MMAHVPSVVSCGYISPESRDIFKSDEAASAGLGNMRVKMMMQEDGCTISLHHHSYDKGPEESGVEEF
jgi:hypothetical protein